MLSRLQYLLFDLLELFLDNLVIIISFFRMEIHNIYIQYLVFKILILLLYILKTVMTILNFGARI